MRQLPPTSFPSDQLFDRRQVIAGASSLAALFALQCKGIGPPPPLKHHAFPPVPLSSDDTVNVPHGYACKALLPWGTPLRPGAPAWNIADGEPQQRGQSGMHHDGMAFFPTAGSSTRGILAINHEYTDEGLLHADGIAKWNAAKVAKSKAAVGVSIVEVECVGTEWQVRGGTRITALDRIEFSGPAKGRRLLQTTAGGEPWEQNGTAVEGTFGNCANGVTPWGTYLTCEENFPDWFAYTKPKPDPKADPKADPATVKAPDPATVKAPDPARRPLERLERYLFGEPIKTVAVPKAKELGWRSGYGWHLDPRFDLNVPESRNHSNRFGWVVEIDPREPTKRTKRTALGRFRHENAIVVVAPDGRVVVYMGDDARFEYIYKFVTKERFEPGNPDHNWKLLDEGTLYVARFDADNTGEWLELSPDVPAIKKSGEFDDLGEVVVFARRAADLVGATKMDRPEWIAVDQDPQTRAIRSAYVSLTNNDKRGTADKPAPDAANPRPANVYGHLLRWRDAAGDPTATKLEWSVFVLAGNRQQADPNQRGTIVDAPGTTDQDFGSPDGLTMDPRGGVLWVQTDIAIVMQRDPCYQRLGNNQMVAIDVATGAVRRFLTGPRGCEITGLAFTPDRKTMFVNIQHPGEGGEEFSDSAQPLAVSRWPTGDKDGRPRSATVVITRSDGGEIGT